MVILPPSRPVLENEMRLFLFPAPQSSVYLISPPHIDSCIKRSTCADCPEAQPAGVTNSGSIGRHPVSHLSQVTLSPELYPLLHSPLLHDLLASQGWLSPCS